MVKFGKHQQVFLENLGGESDLYTVPYDEFKYQYITGAAADGDDDDGDDKNKEESEATVATSNNDEERQDTTASTADAAPNTTSTSDNNANGEEKGKKYSKQELERKIKHLLEQCQNTRFPFKKKLVLNGLGLSTEDIPVQALCGTQLGQSLHKLSLATNSMGSVPPELVTNLPILKHLDLSHCELNQLPETWFLPNLQRLNLSHNELTEFPKESVLQGLPELQDLNLFGNKIARIVIPHSNETSKQVLSKLETLNMGYNNLSFLPKGLNVLVALRTMKVMNNFLKSVPEEICDMHLRMIDVSSNPVSHPPLETCERGISSMRRYYHCLRAEGKLPPTSAPTEAIHSSTKSISPYEDFVSHWKECLDNATTDFNARVEGFWDAVFEGIDELKESRGATPDLALRLYLGKLSEQQVGELHLQLKQLHATALLNSEALRKLVKKFDKNCANVNESSKSCCRKLLPLLYSSSICLGLPTLESGMTLIRHFLGIDGEDADAEEAKHLEETRRRLRNLSMDWNNINNNVNQKSVDGNKQPSDHDVYMDGFLPLRKKDSDAVLIDKRNAELRWLRQFVQEFPPHLIGKLVGHRGFHSVKDKSDRRPIENSLTAYEACWSNGIQVCECDIALTKDERIILAHDENFTRLALDPTDELCKKKVQDLTYREIISLPLKSGNRPPLLFDVLRSADAIGENARMIVEIKPGNVEAGTALARLFARHPDLMERCAVVMSFDAFAMHQFRKELTHVMDHLMLEHHRQQLTQQQQHHSHTKLVPNHPLSRSRSKSVGNHRPGHSRGLSAANLVIPTAMSIGMGLEDVVTEAVHFPPVVPKHKRIDSTDHFGVGMTLNNSADNLMDASFQFHPFAAAGAINKNPQKVLSPLARANSKDGKPPLPSPPSAATTASATTTSDNSNRTLHGPDEAKAEHNDGVVDLGFGQFTRLGDRIPSFASAGVALDPIPADEPAPIVDPSTVASPQHQSDHMLLYRPKLLLITVAEPPKKECELQVSVQDFSRIDNWLRGGAAGSLDGVYLQYEPEMLSPDGVAKMQELTSKFDVGIWGANPEPDDFATFERLVEDCGVQWVNSSLPRKFMSKK